MASEIASQQTAIITAPETSNFRGLNFCFYILNAILRCQGVLASSGQLKF